MIGMGAGVDVFWSALLCHRARADHVWGVTSGCLGGRRLLAMVSGALVLIVQLDAMLGLYVMHRSVRARLYCCSLLGASTRAYFSVPLALQGIWSCRRATHRTQCPLWWLTLVKPSMQVLGWMPAGPWLEAVGPYLQATAVLVAGKRGCGMCEQE